MPERHSKYIIIGAGLSGLTTAYELISQGEEDFIILESRDRIGGRILTDNGIDLGATWFQNHHTYLSQMLERLNIERYEQFSKGKSVLVYNSMAPAHYFESDPNAPSAFRIKNGSKTLIETLASHFSNKIKLNTKVSDIIEVGDTIKVKTNSNTFSASKIVIAFPPKIVKHITFEPSLPNDITSAMQQTHTWMSNAIKVGITFKTPFWRLVDFSGTIIGQVGAVTELYDHTNQEQTEFSLMGFVNEGLRDLSYEDRKERILSYIEKYLGSEIRSYTDYSEKDWSTDPNTSCENLKSVYISPSYGNPLYQKFYLNEKLLFSGAETSPIHGGYMDGAIYSGLNTAYKLLKH